MYYRIKRTPLPVGLSLLDQPHPAEISVPTFVHNDIMHHPTLDIMNHPTFDIMYHPTLSVFESKEHGLCTICSYLVPWKELWLIWIFTLSQIVKKNWCDIKQCILKSIFKAITKTTKYFRCRHCCHDGDHEQKWSNGHVQWSDGDARGWRGFRALASHKVRLFLLLCASFCWQGTFSWFTLLQNWSFRCNSCMAEPIMNA